MDAELQVDTTNFSAGCDQLHSVFQKDVQAVMLRGFRGFMRRAMGITPPAYGERGEGGALKHSDKKRGEQAILSDLSSLFIPVKLKGERKEQWPDVAGIHRRIFTTSKRPGKRLRRGGRADFYVDRIKLKALTKDLFDRVGRLAAGWLSGALAVKATGIPGWVRRHGTRGGRHRLVLDAYNTSLTVAHTSVPPFLVAELNRRMGYALHYTGNALMREADAIVAKRAARFGRR